MLGERTRGRPRAPVYPNAATRTRGMERRAAVSTPTTRRSSATYPHRKPPGAIRRVRSRSTTRKSASATSGASVRDGRSPVIRRLRVAQAFAANTAMAEPSACRARRPKRARLEIIRVDARMKKSLGLANASTVGSATSETRALGAICALRERPVDCGTNATRCLVSADGPSARPKELEARASIDAPEAFRAPSSTHLG